MPGRTESRIEAPGQSAFRRPAVTAGLDMHSIGYVPATAIMPAVGVRCAAALLTRRRVVDFCRVSTALCRHRRGR
jgi:hypothetical protein